MLSTKQWMHFCRLAGVASLNVGQPGIGKTDKAKQYAQDVAISMKRIFVEWNNLDDQEREMLAADPEYRRARYVFFDIRLVNYEPTDLKGLPDFQRIILRMSPEEAIEAAAEFDKQCLKKAEESGITVVRWAPNIQFYVMAQKETAGCTFFDEFTLCPPSIQAAAYQVILDRTIGDIRISDDIFMTAAGNRPEDKTGAFALGMALKNRFSHRTEVAPTIKEWTEWAIENGVHSNVIAYLNFQPSHALDDLMKAYKSGGNAYATYRTWVMGSRLIVAAEQDLKRKLDYQMEQDLIESTVGQGHAATYRAFVELLRDIKIDDVIKKPSMLTDWMDQQKMDQVWAVIGAMPDWYRANESAENRTAILDLVDHLDIDFAVAMIRMLLRRFDKLSGQFLKCPNKTVVAKIAKYL